MNAAVARGEIIKKHPSFQMQLLAVQQIVSLIALDTPVEVIGRISHASREVSRCVRNRNESLKKFAVRFQGLAQVNLRISGASQTDPAGMVLALTFLENANLQPETRTQIQLQLSKGNEMDLVPLSDRSFIWDDHSKIDEYAEGHSDDDESDSSNILLTPEAVAVKERAGERKRADKKYLVPDKLFEQPAGTPLPTMTIDDIFVVMNRMPDLPEKANDCVSTKQLKSFMASVKRDKGSSGHSSGADVPRNSRADQARPNNKRPLDTNGAASSTAECFRCYSLDHLFWDCPVKEEKCSHCGKMGHVNWLCFSKHDKHNVTMAERKQ